MKKCLHRRQKQNRLIEVWEDTESRWITIDSEHMQSNINLMHPHKLLLPYLHPMLSSLKLSQNKISHILIVGLGGGAMIHYLNKFYPTCEITVIEIDTDVISLSQDFFGISTKNNRIKIIHGDAFSIPYQTQDRFDIIFVDLTIIDVKKHINLHMPCLQALKAGGICAINTACFNKNDAKIALTSFAKTFKNKAISIPVKNTQNLISIGWVNSKKQVDIDKLIEEGHISLEEHESNTYGLIASRFY